METARREVSRARLFEIPADDRETIAGELTAKQALFAAAWAETGNKAAAYRTAYDVGDRTLPATIWSAASVIAAIPKVQARYKELCEQALLETIYSVRELFQHQVNIATADPNELMRTVVHCCRHCHGFNHEYQFRDEDELIDAQAKALDDKKQPPSGLGGFGFNAALEPVKTCTKCYGEGLPHVVISDTTKLTGKARALYAGAEQDRWGCIKIRTHDQQKASDFIGKMMGVFKESGLDLRTDAQKQTDKERARIPDNCNEDEAGRAYLSMLDSLP